MVVEGSAAHAQGLQVGDILTSVNGMAVNRFAETADAPWVKGGRGKVALEDILFMEALSGKPVHLQVRRRGAAEPVGITITPQPLTGAARAFFPPFDEQQFVIIDGLVMVDVNQSVLEAVPLNAEGSKAIPSLTSLMYVSKVIVSNVLGGTRAATSGGVVVGDFMESVNGAPVRSSKDVMDAVMAISAEGTEGAGGTGGGGRRLHFIAASGTEYTTDAATIRQQYEVMAGPSMRVENVYRGPA